MTFKCDQLISTFRLACCDLFNSRHLDIFSLSSHQICPQIDPYLPSDLTTSYVAHKNLYLVHPLFRDYVSAWLSFPLHHLGRKLREGGKGGGVALDVTHPVFEECMHRPHFCYCGTNSLRTYSPPAHLHSVSIKRPTKVVSCLNTLGSGCLNTTQLFFTLNPTWHVNTLGVNET